MTYRQFWILSLSRNFSNWCWTFYHNMNPSLDSSLSPGVMVFGKISFRSQFVIEANLLLEQSDLYGVIEIVEETTRIEIEKEKSRKDVRRQAKTKEKRLRQWQFLYFSWKISYNLSLLHFYFVFFLFFSPLTRHHNKNIILSHSYVWIHWLTRFEVNFWSSKRNVEFDTNIPANIPEILQNLFWVFIYDFEKPPRQSLTVLQIYWQNFSKNY